MNTDQGIDLSPLDPERDPDSLERVVSRVLERLGPAIVEDPPSLVHEVAQSYAHGFRPLFAAASAIAIAASLLLLLGRRDGPSPDGRPTEMVEVPGAWASWMASGTPPTTEDLLFSLVREDR